MWTYQIWFRIFKKELKKKKKENWKFIFVAWCLNRYLYWFPQEKISEVFFLKNWSLFLQYNFKTLSFLSWSLLKMKICLKKLKNVIKFKNGILMATFFLNNFIFLFYKLCDFFLFYRWSKNKIIYDIKTTNK